MAARMAAFDAPMSSTATRRQLLHGALGALALGCAPPRGASALHALPASSRAVAEIEQRVGGRVGVFALDTGTGRSLAHRSEERFPMCSTFKWVLAAHVLARVDRRELSLEERVPYGPDALLEHAPATRAHLAEGSMSVAELAHAAVTVSDNTAANLLLAKTDGPSGLTRFVRAHGDSTTRLDRDEPALNDHERGDVRDTTSPRAMASLMRRILCDDALSAASRARLLEWLCASETGKERLRAGLPKDWTVGDKTGTGRRGAVHDVAIAWPPRRAPVLITAYLEGSEADVPVLVAAHAAIGALVAKEL